jgi:hypothetical protein
MIKILLSGVGTGLFYMLIAWLGAKDEYEWITFPLVAAFIISGILIGYKVADDSSTFSGEGWIGGCAGSIVGLVSFIVVAFMIDHVSLTTGVIICVIAGAAPWIPTELKEIISSIDDNKRYKLNKKANERAEKIKEHNDAIYRRNEAEEARRKAEKERKDAEREQRQRNVADVKEKLSNAVRQCQQDVRISEMWELRPNYEAAALQRDVWAATDDASAQLQRLEDIVSELKRAAG